MSPFIRTRIAAPLALLLVAAILAACSSLAPAAQPARLTIIARDFAYDLPAQIEAGLTTITLKNEGAEPHHAQFARVNDDVSDEQMMAALQQGVEAAMPLVTFPGGPAVVPPGKSTEVTIDLTPGRYIVLCLVPGHDGAPHVAKGMIAMTKVVASTARPATPPKSDLTITMQDFSFTMPETLKAGPQVWQIVNKGPQPHEIALIKLAEGKTIDDVMDWMHHPMGPPPYEDAGGMQGLTAGGTGYFHVDLKPGVYVALCHIPDPHTGKAHEELGMVKMFTVN